MTKIYDLKKARREIARAKRDALRGRKPRMWALVLAIGALGVAAVGAELLPDRPSSTTSGADVYVIDGDTIRLPDGERVRLLGIDAPEMPPRSACEQEAALALDAKARLLSLVRAGELKLYAGKDDRDRYGRLLRRVEANGEDLGQTLVREGLAQHWKGRKATWCGQQPQTDRWQSQSAARARE